MSKIQIVNIKHGNSITVVHTSSTGSKIHIPIINGQVIMTNGNKNTKKKAPTPPNQIKTGRPLPINIIGISVYL